MISRETGTSPLGGILAGPHSQGLSLVSGSGMMEGDRKQADLTRETLAFWQPRCSRPLSDEAAREIIENVTGVFRILLEWDRALATKPGPAARRGGVDVSRGGGGDSHA